MSNIRSKQYVYIDSSFRSDGTDGKFTFDLKLKPNNDFDSVCVLQANIPKSWYNVQSGYNSFTLQEGLSTATVSISAGNYNESSIMATVQDALNAASPNRYTYAVSTSSGNEVDDGKFTFTVSGNSNVQPAFIFTDGLYTEFGFDINSTNLFTGNMLRSTNVMNLNSQTVIYIHSDITTNTDDNILVALYGVQDPSYGNIVYECKDREAGTKDLATNTHNIATFSITDSDGEPLDLNGQSVNMTLLFYKKQDIYELIREYIKLELRKSLPEEK